jgi:hypothetical protein
MDILIHVGLHKTGTTSVQDQLYRSRKCLLAAGILYPKAGLFGSQHALIPGSIIPKHLFLDRVKRSLCTRDYLDQLSAEVSAAKPELAILSSEVFSEITHDREACLSILHQISKGFTTCKLLLTIRDAKELAVSALKHSVRERIKPWIQDPISSYRRAHSSISSLQCFWENAGFPISLKSIDGNNTGNLTDHYFGEIIESYSSYGRECIASASSMQTMGKDQKLNSDKLPAYTYAILFLIGNTEKSHLLTQRPIFSIIARLVEENSFYKEDLQTITTRHLIDYLEYFRLQADSNSPPSNHASVRMQDKILALNSADVSVEAVRALTSVASEIIDTM